MPKRLSHADCFASYGTKKVNPRQSWSARNEATKTVVATLWRDRFENGIDLYRSHTHVSEVGWESRPGHAELIDNLLWARDHCDGEIRVILAKPEDPLANPRRIAECYPRPDIIMKVTEIDELTGDFSLARIAS